MLALSKDGCFSHLLKRLTLSYFLGGGVHQIRAMWHACLLRHRMAQASAKAAALSGAGGACQAPGAARSSGDSVEGEARIVNGGDMEYWHAQAEESWPRAQAALEAAGWDLQSAYIDGDEGCLALENDDEDC